MKVILIALLSLFCLTGCMSTETVETRAEAEETEMIETTLPDPVSIANDLELSSAIQELVACEERTAESIADQISLVEIRDITEIEMIRNDEIYTILELTTEDQTTYYVYLESGYFLSKITENDLDGEIVYRQIE